MANYENVVKKLQYLITEKDLEKIPHQIDDKIIIGHILVKPTKSGNYIVIDRKNNTTALFYSKISAVAYAKNIKYKNIKDSILKIDNILSKHDLDCVFYKNTIKKSKIRLRRTIAEDRYYISKHYVNECKEKLYNLIFN